MARVVIVEDHALLAQSLALALRADGLDVVTCPVLEADAILATVKDSTADVVLLDLDLGGELGSSLALIPSLHATGARVVMMTGVLDRARLAACVEAGAIGIISKAEPFERLVAGVKEAVQLGTLLTRSQRDELMAELRRQRASLELFSRLTPREEQVLAALMDGKSAEQIRVEWVVSLATVRSQIQSVLLKLGVSSQLSAVSLARKAEWSPRRA